MRHLRLLAVLLPFLLNACASEDPAGPPLNADGSGELAKDAFQARALDIIPLPTGFRPEGIAIARGPNFFVGSLADGSIYRGDARTGAGSVITGPAGQPAVGLGLSQRGHRLFVAGGNSGTAVVYDTDSGEALLSTPLTTSSPTFVNDVVVTRSAAYFTDSFRPYLYRLVWGRGRLMLSSASVEEIPLSGDFEFIPGSFNANGIAASADGRWLIVVNSTTGSLYRVDPETGNATAIDLGGETVDNGDGLLLEGRDLYVVQNLQNRIAHVRLDPSLTAGTVVEIIFDPALRIPSTVASFGDALYAVNARFGVDDPANAEYEVVVLDKH